MTPQEPLPTAPSVPVSIDTHAAATLRYIRASMEAATTVPVPGSAGIAMGTVGLVTAALTSSSGLHPYWLPLWLIAAVFAAGVGGALVARPASWRVLARAGTPVRRLALCLLPSILGGAVLTAVDWRAGNTQVIPGTWLLLYGCALVAATVATSRMIGLMGALFMALGVLALWTPDRLQILLLGLGFGGLHIVFGCIIGRLGHGRQI